MSAAFAQPDKKRPSLTRFNFVMSKKERKDIHALAEEYSRELGIKMPAAFIVRMGLQEIVPKMRAELRKAVNGRYHAKIRKEYSQ